MKKQFAFYLFSTLNPVRGDKPAMTVHATSIDHARIKIEALRGLPVQQSETLISAQQFRDDNAQVREIISMNRGELRNKYRIWDM